VGVACHAQQDYPQRPLIRILFNHVRRTVLLIPLLLCAFLCFDGAGCKKEAQPKTPEEALLALRQSLATAPREVQDILYNTVDTGIRYGKTQDAIAGLEKIAAEPSLNPQQKKLATDVANMLRAKATPQ